MAWSAPLTAVANAVFTAAQWNASLRDNLLQTGPAIATTADRLIVSNGANTIAERDILAGFVGTTESSSSGSYVDLATVGPSVTITTGGKGLVSVGCLMSNATAAKGGWMSYAISGATTAAASDAYAFVATSSAANELYGASHLMLWTNLIAGSSTFTAKYRVSGAFVHSWQQRRMIVMAL